MLEEYFQSFLKISLVFLRIYKTFIYSQILFESLYWMMAFYKVSGPRNSSPRIGNTSNYNYCIFNKLDGCINQLNHITNSFFLINMHSPDTVC